MATNTQVIEDALRLIGVLRETESPSAAQAVAGLRSMNNLFAEWKANNIEVGYYPQTSLTATSPIDAESLQAALYNLAVILAAGYGIAVPAEVGFIAESGYRRLMRESIVDAMEPVQMNANYLGTGYHREYDIENG